MEEKKETKKVGFWASVKHAYYYAEEYPSYIRGKRVGAWLRIVLGTAILFILFWVISGWLHVDMVIRQIFGTWILTSSATIIAYLIYAKYTAYLDYLNKSWSDAKDFALIVRRSLMTLDYAAGILILSRNLGVHLWECLPENVLVELQETGNFLKLADDTTRTEFLILTVGIDIARNRWSKVLDPETTLTGTSIDRGAAQEELEAKADSIRNILFEQIEKARSHFEEWRPDVLGFQKNYIDALREEGMFD
jgi:hypothetical protein